MANSGARAEGDKVVPISRGKEIRERRPPFRNASPSTSGGIRSDDEPSASPNRGTGPGTKEKRVSANTCAYVLNGLAPLADSLQKLLEIPQTVFMSDDLSSFTSEPGKHAVAMARALAYNEPLPKDLPEYGICLFRNNRTQFCLLVDKRRKIAVFNSISNLPGGQGDWDLFEDSLAEALEQAKKLQLGGEVFSFVLMNRFIGTRIDPEKLAKSEECVRTLNALAPMSEKLKLYLLMPKSLYVGGQNEFLSEPDKHLDVAAISSSTITSVPQDLPHYGITTFTEGGKVMCALVDSNRRIIVIEEVLDTKTRQGSWERFESSLLLATDRAAELQVDAKLDHFIIARNGVIEG